MSGTNLLRTVLGLSLAGALSLAGGCQSEEGPSVGSQTNWLKSCNNSGECGELECVCGTCTVACVSNDACDDLGESSCIRMDDKGAVALCNGLTPAAPLCLQRCEDGSCPDGSECVAGVCAPERDATVHVSIDPSNTHQELIGFGAAVSYDGDFIAAHPQKDALYDVMFSDSGLDIIRIRSRWQGDNPQNLAAAADIVAGAKERMSRSPLIFLSSSSPPGALKANGVRFCGNSDPNCTLVRDTTGAFDYAAFAEYWRSTVEAYESLGITADFISIQNNPDWMPASDAGGETCRFLPQEGTATVRLTDGTTVEAEFPGYDRALAAVRSTLGTDRTYVAPDAGRLSALKAYTDILPVEEYDSVGYHLFTNNPPNVPIEELTALKSFVEENGISQMQTEMGANGLGTAILIHHTFVTGGGSAYLQNQFVSQGFDENGGSPIGGDEQTFRIQPAYHALSHFAKHTDPGFRLAEAASDAEDILASTWTSPDEAQAVVVIVNQADDYADVQLSTPTDWVDALSSATVTRTVFNGVERSSELGLLPANNTVRVPGQATVTIVVNK